jgi:PAS domain S-box-containing protein
MGTASIRSVRYTLAILAALGALLLRNVFTPLLGASNPYHTVWLAVIFMAWYCGIGPSVVGTIIAVLGVWYWLLPPANSFAIRDRTEVFGMLGFLIFSGCIIAIGESNRRASTARFRLAAIVDSSDDAIVSKSLNGIITSWNGGAQHLFGWTEREVLGKSITIVIPPELWDEEVEIQKQLRAGGRMDHFETVRVTKDGRKVNVSLSISPVRDLGGNVVGISKIARDITERKHLEEQIRNAYESLEERVRSRTAELEQRNKDLIEQGEVIRRLSGRLLQVQDEERRRLARDLHDSVGQLLAAINMNNAHLDREKENLTKSAQTHLEQNVGLITQVAQEIRTISYLLHPPLLDEIGLASAITWYVDGFEERSKIGVHLDMPPNFERLSRDQEIALFRVVQECLTNVHRHSGSAKAAIRIARENGQIRLEVSDEGRGIPSQKHLALNSYGTFGVGIAGMRERLRQFGGNLEVHSAENGTTVIATLTVEHPRAAISND